MLGSFKKNLSMLITGIVFFFLFGMVVNAVAVRKPWGVPDDRREDYERIVSNLQAQAIKVAKYKGIDRPNARLLSSTLRLGMIQPNQTCSAEVTLENVGQLPMKVSLADQSIAGLTARLSSTRIEPGERATITASGDASDVKFIEDQTLTVRTNDPLQETLQLRITGTFAQMIKVPKVVLCNVGNPGDDLSCQLQVSSEQDQPLEVEAIRCGSESFVWHAQKANPADTNTETMHAVDVHLSHQRFEYGRYQLPVEIDVRQDGKIQTHTIMMGGRIRSPISFKSPDLHRETGLSIGTVSSTREHSVHVGVSLRSETHRRLEILDTKPDELKTSLTTMGSTGLHKLTITIPKNCKTLVFNRPMQHGYVKVGDPHDPKFSSWLPLYGVVANEK